MTSTLCGCSTYRAAPLVPSEAAHDFDQRSLADPALCSYLRADLGNSLPTCPPDRWDLATLTLAAFFYNPDLAVAQANLTVAKAAIITARERPNPSFGLGPAYTASAAPSFAPWAIAAAQVNFPIETAGKRGYRVAQADHLRDAAALQIAETGWRVRSGVRAALVNYLVAQRQYELARSYESASERIANLLQERLDAGAASAPELNLALANLAAARLKMAQAESLVPETRNALAAAMGVPIESLQGKIFLWPQLDRPPDENSLTPASVQQMALFNRIDIGRMLAQYAAADEALKLEIARQYPDINLGGGYSWEVNENIFELVPVITLPLMNQNQGPIAEAKARRAQIAAEFMALQDSVIAQSKGALTSYRGALRAYEQGSSSAAFSERRMASMRRAAELGDADALTLASAQLQSVLAQQAKLNSLAVAQHDLGELEDAVQRPLGDGGLKSFSLPPSLQNTVAEKNL
ncbi:MAG TPA: TolC family protein [Candidatus Binataceae bacterium]|nr:TolC family protein [Candidatus Binataceae bacterium]